MALIIEAVDQLANMTPPPRIALTIENSFRRGNVPVKPTS
jgi:hypothetical protein